MSTPASVLFCPDAQDYVLALPPGSIHTPSPPSYRYRGECTPERSPDSSMPSPSIPPSPATNSSTDYAQSIEDTAKRCSQPATAPPPNSQATSDPRKYH